MRNPKILLLLCSTLMIHGCSGGQAQQSGWTAVLELTGVRCPSFDARDKAEARRYVPRPKADTVNAKGQPAVSRGASQAWIDQLESAQERKNQVIERMDTEHERCRDPDGKGKTTS